MNARTERHLMRLLTGDLPAAEARALEERIAGDAELAAAYRRLEELWRGLEPPPARPVPPGFAARVVSRALAERRGAASLAGAPAGVRAAAALALAAGVALGVGLGLWQDLGAAAAGDPPAAELAEVLDPDESLAEAYWGAVGDIDGGGGDGGGIDDVGVDGGEAGGASPEGEPSREEMR